MSVKKLPTDIQSLLCASVQICNYKRAVEELVFNSLDANSTSIAIRVNIDNNTIQVIDNGHGIKRSDFDLLGQRYATSNNVDLTTLKSAPNKYGFRGEALSSIIEISQSVKITAKYQECKDTWVKIFSKTKKSKILQCTERPSKGTTVEIHGFLYNLKIQRKSIDSLIELNNIKLFLEQLSIVHNNISLSLRDDAKNEIILQIHKNRDIYQTFSTMFGLNKKDLQELRIEKNEYKVTAFIGKKDVESYSKHWVYLNGRLLSNSKIHKLIDDNLSKILKLRIKANTKAKSKTKFNEEENFNNSAIPSYFLFITCPYFDYDTNNVSKQSTVEFKNWEQVTKLLDKLIKFYAGEVSVKEIKNDAHKGNTDKKEKTTRLQVKCIMEKILGSNPRKIGVSQMHRGVKGNLIKRRPKKNIQKLKFINIKPNKEVSHLKDIKISSKVTNISIPSKQINLNNNPKSNTSIHKEHRSDFVAVTNKCKNKLPLKAKKNMKDATKPQEKTINHNQIYKNIKCKRNNTINKPYDNLKIRKGTQTKLNRKKDAENKKKVDVMLKKFKDDPTGSIKRRCNILTGKVEAALSYKNNRKQKIFINETVHYSNVVQNNKNYSVRKKVDEIVIHDYIPLPPIFKPEIGPEINKPHKSSYDLIKTVLRTQETKTTKDFQLNVNPLFYQTNNIQMDGSSISDDCFNSYLNSSIKKNDFDNIPNNNGLPKLTTYESHSHNMEFTKRISHEYNFIYNTNQKKMSKCLQFISTKSRDNFIVPCEPPKRMFRSHFFKPFSFKSKPNITTYSKRFQDYNDLDQTSHTIEFTQTEENEELLSENNLSSKINTIYDTIDGGSEKQNKYYTYTIEHDDNHINNATINSTYAINQSNSPCLANQPKIYNSKKNASSSSDKERTVVGKNDYDNNFQKGIINNIIFISESQEPNSSQENLLNIDPLNVCETLLSDEMSEQYCNNNRYDSLFNEDFDIDSVLCDRNAYMQLESRHYIPEIIRNENQLGMNDVPDQDLDIDQNSVLLNKETEPNFKLNVRPRFLPKGMSQIFNNCQTKNSCEYNFDTDYYHYEKNIYKRFVNNIQLNTEIFASEVQNVKELTSRAIEKVNHKLKKDNASLKFDGLSLEYAKVLGQIDNKFIAAKIMVKGQEALQPSEYLVLFDQHAVHERIRLESNLTSYLNGEQWKSVTLEAFVLKLPKDEILFLHNYIDKFTQLGLQLTIEDTEKVSIKAIPAAILGKNARKVDVVIKSVRSLISEEIKAIKSQSGCISLYPKAIMDLVFSEACRYAIKFGDNLSMDDCKKLLQSLSVCKTPFQCAHGRPVLAVIMDIKRDLWKYKADMGNISKWLKLRKQR